MRSSFRKPAWIAIAIAFLAVLSCVVTVIAGTPAPAAQPAPGTGAITSVPSACLHAQDTFLPQKETCSHVFLDLCEHVCLRPGGVLDLYCYEDCISSVC